MTTLTAARALRDGWAERAVLYRDIKTGRLAARVGGRRTTVDMTDLIRVYGAPMSRGGPSHPDDVELDVLRHENRRLRKRLDAEHKHGTELLVLTWRHAMTGELPRCRPGGCGGGCSEWRVSERRPVM